MKIILLDVVVNIFLILFFCFFALYNDKIKFSENHVVVVMINVIGHALGLFLSDEEESLMYPVYSEQMNNLQFFGDEIEAIERLYGDNDNYPVNE